MNECQNCDLLLWETFLDIRGRAVCRGCFQQGRIIAMEALLDRADDLRKARLENT